MASRIAQVHSLDYAHDHRAHPRYRVRAQAIWERDGVEYRYTVSNLSWGGAALIVGPLMIPAGTRLRVRFVQPARELGGALVEVVHITDRRMGLRFLEMDKGLQAALDDLFADLTPGT